MRRVQLESITCMRSCPDCPLMLALVKATNYCICVTVATMLCAAGVSNQGIMSVTGNHSAKSLDSYAVPSDQDRRMSSGITHTGGLTDMALASKSSGMRAEEVA